MIMMNPYMPEYTQKIMGYFGKSIRETKVGTKARDGYTWSDLGKISGLSDVKPTEIFFKPLDEKTMLSFRKKFSGKSKEQNPKKKIDDSGSLPLDMQAEHFEKNIRLRVAKVVKIERNPDSDKLYIEHLDDGSGTDRVIQSGLVPYLKEDEILGRNVVIVDNLAPRKMRGVESRGMLLAADYKKSDGSDGVELVEVPWAKPGTEVVLEGTSEGLEKSENVDASIFFKIEIKVEEKNVQIAGKNLTALGKPLTTNLTVDGSVS